MYVRTVVSIYYTIRAGPAELSLLSELLSTRTFWIRSRSIVINLSPVVCFPVCPQVRANVAKGLKEVRILLAIISFYLGVCGASQRDLQSRRSDADDRCHDALYVYSGSNHGL